MKKIAFLTLLLLGFTSCKTPVSKVIASKALPNIELKLVKNLAPQLTETSGLEYYHNLIITHNDSGDQPTLYFLDQQGNLLYNKTYKNMNAIDWEDVTKDDTYLYIADIGNNYGNRKDLTIYKIALKDLDNENALVEELHISYPDQKTFTQGNQDHPYDAESIVAIENDLYLFSKDWTDQTTVIYKLHKNQKNQAAQKISSYNIKGLVTGATFNGTDTVLLCGYNSSLTPFVFKILYENGRFEFLDKQEIDIYGGAQVEAISYLTTKNNKEIYYFSCEAANIQLGEDEALSQAQLYQLKWKR
jgi:hypothetical protein